MLWILIASVIGIVIKGVVPQTCPTEPTAPWNAEINCSNSECKITCNDKYEFSNGKSELYMQCRYGKWIDVRTNSLTIPPCQAICSPPCMNNGQCVAPNQCKCVGNYMRPNCQFKNIPCVKQPTIPLNSKRVCKGLMCTFTCIAGQAFPNGTTKAISTCEGGRWIPENADWKTIPDCKATCNPPCQNKGTCLQYNVCQCSEHFRGTQCQYSTDVCSGRNLNFNGGYNCVGDDESYKCSLSCPEKSRFPSKPEQSYVCTYDTGLFKPDPLPPCVFENNMEAVPTHRTSHSNLKTKKITVQYNNSPKVVQIGEHIKYETLKVVAQKVAVPTPGTCFSWGGAHYNSFDGKIFSVDSDCEQTLVKDSYEDTFTISTLNNPCKDDPKTCYKILKINIYGQEYILKKTDAGIPILVLPKQILPIPARLDNIRTERDENFIMVHLDLVGVNIKWDGQQFIQVDAGIEMWQKTSGMCGSLDGDLDNDIIKEDGNKPDNLIDFAQSWQTNTEDKCRLQKDTHDCTPVAAQPTLHKAEQFCRKILTHSKFASCQKLIDPLSLINACTWEYCGCKDDLEECACKTLNIYVKMCTHKGITNLGHWRDSNICPMKCTDGKMYMTCMPREGQLACGDSLQPASNLNCEEGCYCPVGTFLHNNKCIPKSKCPCQWQGKEHTPGQTLTKECETCTCNNGQWSCNKKSCNAQCTAVGDPHYSTFDGRRFNFMGQCNYYFLKTPTFSIEGENVGCYGPHISCNNAVIIKLYGQKIKLLQNKVVQVNSTTVTTLPYYVPGATIKMQTSHQVAVNLDNGIQVLWNGPSYLVQINAPPSFKNRTQGLCGTWNDNPSDDFLTSDGIIENNVNTFANSWITKERCKAAEPIIPPNPCDNKNNKIFAEAHCKTLKSDLFKPCHLAVDVTNYYEDCVYDMCACGAKNDVSCLCAPLSTYAAKCARAGIVVDWRQNTKECKTTCPAGQVYQTCGNPCTRSCFDMTDDKCSDLCGEGCYCHEGTTLDENGACIPIDKCKCKYNGLESPGGHKEIRLNADKYDLCTCDYARWECRTATAEEIMKYPQPDDSKLMCNATRNLVFTNCEPFEPRTCKNIKEVDMPTLPPTCNPGCECKMGYVFDTHSEECVKPKDCTCFHDGKFYKENESIKNGCNQCKCQNAKWVCVEAECTGICGAWGESHFKSFDGKIYNFKGQCQYTFVKSVGNENKQFEITMQNLFCEDAGVNCKKEIDVSIRLGHKTETILLQKNSKAKQYDLFSISIKEPFVILESSELGLIIRWDKKSRVYVIVDSQWKNKLSGLCGNYNDNDMDDFKTSSGVSEVSPEIFANSWKKGYCAELDDLEVLPESTDNEESEKCNVLKSDVFKQCHTKIPVDKYFDNCIHDSYSSDDKHYENICATIAAYSDECSELGFHIPWRTAQLCPMQCGENKKYSPCVPKSSYVTCDNILKKIPHNDGACVEGCEPKPCPPNYIYLDSKLNECVLKSECKPLCLEVGEHKFHEGDMIDEDDCFRSFCSQGKEIISGQSCDPVYDAPQIQSDESVCVPSWTNWQKYNGAITNKNGCKASDIDCRTMNSHIGYKDTGLMVECSLENGIICNSKNGQKCPYFEYRILCSCGDEKPNNNNQEVEKKCPTGKVWDDCATKCDRLCVFYLNTLQARGKCIGNTKCESGCVEETKTMCDRGQFWANKVTCVRREDCPCASHSGIKIRPGTTFQETDCLTCQCVDNYYECDRSSCPTEEFEEEFVEEIEDITTENPTVNNDANQKPTFINLIEGTQPLPDNAFSASSSMGPYFAPQMARIKKKISSNSGGSWIPSTSDEQQYLQIDLGSDKDIYGIIIKGSPLYSEYVESFKLFYANNGDDKFKQVLDEDSQRQIFSGSIDGISPKEHIFKKPINARIIRIKPHTWNIRIALRVELLGLNQEPKNKMPVKQEECFDVMGIEDGELVDQQIETSSDYGDNNKKSDVRLTEGSAWRPLKNSPHEFVEFNFLEPRKVNCITTKGGPLGWVTEYRVKYSHDGKVWIPINEGKFTEKLFKGNHNSNSPKTNNLGTLNAKMLRIHPTKWHRNIELRVEIHGVFKPYPIDNISKLTSANKKSHDCNYCPGIENIDTSTECKCDKSLLWDGKKCVGKSNCPCVVGNFQYSVGSVYLHKCAQCVCTIGGKSYCKPKKCEKCEKGLQSIVTNKCDCVCIPCEENKTLCPSSNICIDSELWCDGYKDCPDDEINCSSNAAKKQDLCKMEDIDIKNSIGIISIESQHGLCENKKPLLGHKNCIGSCTSSVYFNPKNQQYESQCSSCQAVELKPMFVEMTCNDNYKYEKQIMVPTKCGCAGCNNWDSIIS